MGQQSNTPNVATSFAEAADATNIKPQALRKFAVTGRGLSGKAQKALYEATGGPGGWASIVSGQVDIGVEASPS